MGSQQKQQSRRRKSQGEREREDDLNRSRRSSKSRLQEEDLPENYADLAKRVYKMAEKEGWSQQKVFELLKDPVKLVKTMEHVRYSNSLKTSQRLLGYKTSMLEYKF